MSNLTSEVEFIEFFATVVQDQTLLSQFMTAISKKNDAAIINMAREQGFDINSEMLRQGLQTVFNQVAPSLLVS
jgi:Nif11 domain